MQFCDRSSGNSAATARHYNFNATSDAHSIFRYHMHTLPDEVSGPIGTSTLFAAWNAAIYVAQIEEISDWPKSYASVATSRRRIGC